MTAIAKKRQELRVRRHRRVRKKVHGTAARPRLAIYRSNKHLSAQVIDDDSGRTIVSASSLEGWCSTAAAFSITAALRPSPKRLAPQDWSSND